MTAALGRRLPALALVAVAAIAVTACVPKIPGQGKPPKLFSLTPKSSYAPDLPRVTTQLVVETPVTAESLNSTRIAVRRKPLSLDYYQGARWTERAPLMVQTLLVESFENSGRILAVGRRSTDLRADFVLKTDLREFQAEYGDKGETLVRVRLNLKLVKMPQRTIVAAKTVEHEITAAGDRIYQVVAAFDDALGKVLKVSVQWTLRALAKQAKSG